MTNSYTNMECFIETVILCIGRDAGHTYHEYTPGHTDEVNNIEYVTADTDMYAQITYDIPDTTRPRHQFTRTPSDYLDPVALMRKKRKSKERSATPNEIEDSYECMNQATWRVERKEQEAKRGKDDRLSKDNSQCIDYSQHNFGKHNNTQLTVSMCCMYTRCIHVDVVYNNW